MRRVSLVLAGVEAPVRGTMVGKALSAVGVSGGSRGLSFSLQGCLLTPSEHGVSLPPAGLRLHVRASSQGAGSWRAYARHVSLDVA